MVWFDHRIQVNIPHNLKNKTNEPLFANTKERYILFNRDPVEKLWFPDVFIQRAEDIRVPAYKLLPVYLRMYENKKMMYSARVNFDVSCPMKFEEYPIGNRMFIIFEAFLPCLQSSCNAV